MIIKAIKLLKKLSGDCGKTPMGKWAKRQIWLIFVPWFMSIVFGILYFIEGGNWAGLWGGLAVNSFTLFIVIAYIESYQKEIKENFRIELRLYNDELQREREQEKSD